MNGCFTIQTLTFALDLLSSAWLDKVIKTKSMMKHLKQELEENIFVLCQLLRNLLKHMLNEDSCDEAEDETQNSLSTANTLINDDKKDNMKKGPGLGGFMAVLSNTFKTTVEKVQEESDSEDDITISSDEWRKDEWPSTTDHPKHTQLMTKLFMMISTMDDPEVTFYILDCLRSLALNEDCLYETSRKYKKLFFWLQHNHIVSNLWNILDSNHSQVSMLGVPLLLMSLSLPHGADIFWKILDDEFDHEDWKTRFAAVEKTTLIFRFLSEAPVKKSQALRSTLSHAFCHLIASMDDRVPQISQRSTIYLGTVHDKAINCLLGCLEHQFDLIPNDRPIILKNLFQLFNTLTDRNILTWEFFANRFECMISDIQELKNSKQDIEEESVKDVKEEKPIRTRPKSGTDSVRSLVENLKHPYKRTYSAPADIVQKTVHNNVKSDEDKSAEYRRQQSAPLLRQKYSRTNTMTASQSGTLSDELEWKDLAVRSLNIDEVNRESLHLLVFLFMHFLSYPNQTEIPENKNSVKYLGVKRCFHCLYSLLGYDEVQQRFTTMPHKIRTSPQFCSFFSTLSQVMDNNFMIGNLHISNFVMILQRSPFPPRYAANCSPTYSIIQENLIYHGCSYSLWYLEPIVR